MSSKRFDIHVQVRSSYKRPFGVAYLKAAQEYNIEGSRLIKRVFIDWLNEVIIARKKKEAEILEREQALQREKLQLKTGGI